MKRKKIMNPDDCIKNFPFQPYGIQVGLMKGIHGAIENGGIGIFESPTGTGKSLSLICSTLTWLLQSKMKTLKQDNMEDEQNKNEEISRENSGYIDNSNRVLPDWVKEESKKIEKKKRKIIQESSAIPTKIRKTNNNPVCFQQEKRKRIREILKFEERSNENSDPFLLDDPAPSSLSSIINDLYANEFEARLGDSNYKFNFKTPKIIFCMRTHSQMTQFVHEIQKTMFAKSFMMSDEEEEPIELRIQCLLSRTHLCLNTDFKKKYKSSYLLSEKCNENKSTECDFFKDKNFLLYSDNIFALEKQVYVRDIEDLVTFGKTLGICPYYGLRFSLFESDVLILPYNFILHEQMRKSIGIESLEDCIVVFDEAHNVIPSILSSYSCSISENQLRTCLKQCGKYLKKYKNRLKKENKRKLQEFVRIQMNIFKFLKNINNNTRNEQIQEQPNIVMKVNEFQFRSKIEQFNMFEVENFLVKTQLCKKLNGFVENQIQNEEEESESNINDAKSIYEEKNMVYRVKSFLLMLTNIDKDCRILIERGRKEDKTIKFLLLNPGVYFHDILKESRSVIMTGGTMEPIDSLVHQLFPPSSLDIGRNLRSKLRVMKFDHIIPKSSLFVTHVGQMNGLEFNFTFDKRNNPRMIENLGFFILRLCRIVPDGIVVFFPSYNYESFVYDSFKKSGLISKFEEHKKFFREKRGSKEAQGTFEDYKGYINESFPGQPRRKYQPYSGSLLFCVVGAKMSEGINFKDGYGRCVVLVGLPFPNLKNDLELREKMRFQEEKFGKAASQQYYVDLCFTKVNQSIGRSIRHKDDYSSVLLVDSRYFKFRGKIPRWINEKWVFCGNKVESVLSSLSLFFNNKKDLQRKIEIERKEKSLGSN